MKNFEKYKTTRERMIAFDEFRKTHKEWFNAPSCAFKWLDLEAEEKPMPCPFCNNEYVEVGKAVNGMRDVKCICGYRSQAKDSESEVIAAHNRVCKAVAAYKKGEVK